MTPLSQTTEYYRERSRRWQAENPERYRELARNWHAKNKEKQEARRKERRALFAAYKREHGCVDCGAAEGRLEFDHRLGQVKAFDVGARMTSSLEVLWAEVAKCDIRCRSCHNKRHGFGRRGIPKRPKAKR